MVDELVDTVSHICKRNSVQFSGNHIGQAQASLILSSHRSSFSINIQTLAMTNHLLLRRVLLRPGRQSEAMFSRSTFLPASSTSSLAMKRCYASAATTDSGNSNDNRTSGADQTYVSPFQDIFDTIHQGKTFLGTSEFQAPVIRYLKCGIPEHVLKFKTTAFGKLLEAPYIRPNEHRITMKVPIRHIPLSETEQLVLKEIVGTRWNDETGLLQLSSSQFGSRIENKRHVVSMLERAVETAKTLAARVEAEVEQLEKKEQSDQV